MTAPGALLALALVAATPPSAPDVGAVRVRTLIQAWYLADELAPDGFRLRRTYVWVTGLAAPGLGYQLLLNPVRALAPPAIVADPARPGAWLARSGGDDKIVLDAFCRFEVGGATLQVGQFRVPLSAEALEPGSDLVTIRRALFNEAPTQIGLWRDLGLQVRGRPWPWLDAACGVFNGEGQNATDVDHRKDLVARLAAEPMPGLALGLAHQARALGPAGPPRRRTAADVAIPLGPVRVRAEALVGDDGGTPSLGWFAEVSGRPRPEVQLVARYEAWDPDQARAQVRRDLTLGATWFLGPWWGGAPGHDAKVALNVVRQDGPQGGGVAALVQWQVMR